MHPQEVKGPAGSIDLSEDVATTAWYCNTCTSYFQPITALRLERVEVIDVNLTIECWDIIGLHH